MREKLTAEEYEDRYWQLRYSYPTATTQEEWQEFCFELLLHLMEQNEEILKRLKERE